MGKIKHTSKRFGHKVAKHGALADQILNDNYAKASKRNKSRGKQKDSKSKRYVNVTGVLSEMQKLQEEIQFEDEERAGSSQTELFVEKLLNDNDDVTTAQEMRAIMMEFDRDNTAGINLQEEEKIFEGLMPENSNKQKSYIEQFRAIVEERKTEVQTQIDEQSLAGEPLVKEEVKELCEKVGVALTHMRKKPLPKIMKAIPMMRNWLQLMYYTRPENWSAAAVFEVTRQFRGKRSAVAQLYFSKVLLPRCRDDIAYYKTLNVHLYNSLRVAIRRPDAFFNGIILPLCFSGNCTLREALIFGSVMSRCSIPMIASAAAMIRIAELKEYNGACSVFLRVLLNKKYILYSSVIDAVIVHFSRFKLESRQLPVLWHQCLLTLVQRYKTNLSPQQRNELYSLAAFHSHPTITPEVRRELDSVRSL